MTGRAPLPHQKQALWYCQQNPTGALFMEMRLGKTKVIIDHLKRYQGPFLIIAPLPATDDWKSELRVEGEDSIAHLIGSKKQRFLRYLRGCKWNLINFQGLVRNPYVLAHPWQGIVVDESSKIRNPQTLQSRIIVDKFQYKAPLRYVLSGEPAPESPANYFQQFKFIDGHFMGFTNFWKFRHVAFINPVGYDWYPKGVWKTKIRDYVQKRAFIMFKKDVGLANKVTYKVRKIPLTSKQQSLINRIEQEFILEVGDDYQIDTKYVPVTWVWLRQLAGGFIQGQYRFDGKMKELLDLLQGELKNESVVVWFAFNPELWKAYEIFKRNGISCGQYQGDRVKRERAYRKFKRGKIRVLLCQQKVGLYSKDFSAADTAIYFSNGFSWEERNQSEQRIQHPKKRNALLIIDLVTENSIDETILKVLRRKNRNSKFYLHQEIYEGIKRRQKWQLK